MTSFPNDGLAQLRAVRHRSIGGRFHSEFQKIGPISVAPLEQIPRRIGKQHRALQSKLLRCRRWRATPARLAQAQVWQSLPDTLRMLAIPHETHPMLHGRLAVSKQGLACSSRASGAGQYLSFTNLMQIVSFGPFHSWTWAALYFDVKPCCRETVDTGMDSILVEACPSAIYLLAGIDCVPTPSTGP